MFTKSGNKQEKFLHNAKKERKNMMELSFKMGSVDKSLLPSLRSSLHKFLEPHSLSGVEFTATEIGRGGHQNKIVCYSPGLKRAARIPGVPVRVWTTGTQAVYGLLVAKSLTDKELEKIVLAGLVQKKKTQNRTPPPHSSSTRYTFESARGRTAYPRCEGSQSCRK